MKTAADLVCSFCGKSKDEVRSLIAGPGTYICDDCVGLCVEIISEHAGTEDQQLAYVRRLSTAIDAAVHQLRDDGVPWDRIADALRPDDDV